MVNALRRQMQWMAFGSEGNPLQQLHPLRPFVHWYNTRQMNHYIVPEVDAHFERQKAVTTSQKTSPQPQSGKSKSVVDLALAAYLKDSKNSNEADGIDPNFKETAVNQLKLFLFSGHDTTSSTVCYVLYMLSVHSEVLSRVRAEHREILGDDPSLAAETISQTPHLLNKMPYTTAVIKESMRLFPAASTTRTGEPSFTIDDPKTGLKYPAEPGTLIWLISHACHHDPAIWPRSDEFLPERWLANEGDELQVPRGAWRPFEHGPRACIGKELSMLELKIIVCLIARSFDISAVYEELDSQEGRRGQGSKIKSVGGERAYQVGKGEPSEFLPCRVKIRAAEEHSK